MYFLGNKFHIKVYWHVATNNTMSWQDSNNKFIIKLRNKNLSAFSIHAIDLEGYIVVLYGLHISTLKHSNFHCLGNRKEVYVLDLPLGHKRRIQKEEPEVVAKRPQLLSTCCYLMACNEGFPVRECVMYPYVPITPVI